VDLACVLLRTNMTQGQAAAIFEVPQATVAGAHLGGSGTRRIRRTLVRGTPQARPGA
jgi:hypothetical protein